LDFPVPPRKEWMEMMVDIWPYSLCRDPSIEQVGDVFRGVAPHHAVLVECAYELSHAVAMPVG